MSEPRFQGKAFARTPEEVSRAFEVMSGLLRALSPPSGPNPRDPHANALLQPLGLIGWLFGEAEPSATIETFLARGEELLRVKG